MEPEAVTLPEDQQEPEAVDAEEADEAEDADGEAPEGDDDAEESEDGEEKSEEEAGEEIEINLGGTKAKFRKGEPVEVAAERLQQFANDLYSGVNRKFEAIAEQRKVLEARDEALNVMGNLTNDYHLHLGRAQIARDELLKLQSVDWQNLWTSNPDQARRLSDYARQKEQELGHLAQTLQAKEAEAKTVRQRYIETVVEQGKQRVERAIPGFSDKHAREVIDYAHSVGVPKEDAENWALNPEVAVMAYKAMMYDKAAKSAAKPKQPKTIDKPVVAKKARGTGQPDARTLYSDRVSTEEWMRLRQKQLENRNR